MKQCEMYDPLTDEWVTISPLKTGEILSRIGKQNLKITHLFICDEIIIIILSAGRNQAGVCAFGNKLVAVGGCDAWNCLSSMEIYDPVENEWVMGPSMTTNRRGCGIAEFKGIKTARTP